MTDNQPNAAKTPAEEIRRLLEELHGEIVTSEKVPQYRRVRRATDRTVAVLDWRTHTVREPGLLTQLGVIHSTARPGIVVPGAAVPSGSPGWDADGALTPLLGGTLDPGEPVTDAWHTGDEIRHELAQLGRELHEQGWRAPRDTLISIALGDEQTGEWIAARLRTLTSRARVAASYDAPPKPLQDMHCRYCGGQLWVRADASSAVWCSGWLPIHGPALPDDEEGMPIGWARCGRAWPRGSWVALLAEAERQDQEEGEVRAS